MNKRSYQVSRYRNGLMGGTGSTVVVGSVLILFIVLLLLLRFFAPGAIFRVTQPFWQTGSRVTAAVGNTLSLESRTAALRERDAIAEENTSLTVQNAALSARVADLTALLGTRTEPMKGIVAGVLARPPVAPYDVLIIDQGSEDGVASGAIVRGAGGTPIGIVGSVSARSARITLFSARGVTTEGWAGSSRIPVTLTGASGGAFNATVPKEAGVLVGDGVYVGIDGAFPIGTVINVESDPSSPDVALDIRPYANPFSITWVTIERAR